MKSLLRALCPPADKIKVAEYTASWADNLAGFTVMRGGQSVMFIRYDGRTVLPLQKGSVSVQVDHLLRFWPFYKRVLRNLRRRGYRLNLAR